MSLVEDDEKGLDTGPKAGMALTGKLGDRRTRRAAELMALTEEHARRPVGGRNDSG
jgi:hypothetical protein